MTDINVGWGKVLRVRWLKASPKRRHIFRPKVTVQMRSQLFVNYEKAVELMERRRLMLQDGVDVTSITKEIGDLGYAVQDELTRSDFAYSFWRRK